MLLMQRAEQGVFLGDPENSSREMLLGEILQVRQSNTGRGVRLLSSLHVHKRMPTMPR